MSLHERSVCVGCALLFALAAIMVPALTALPCRAESDAAAAADTVHLFILSGQSNMARLDPEKSFTPAVTRALAGDEVLVVKDAQGGEPIRRWYKKWKDAQGKTHEKTGDLYDRLMTKVKAAVADKTPDTVTFVWMQGERDARDKHHSEVYAASLKGLVKQLRDDLGREDVNVVIGRISDYGMRISRSSRWKRVRKAQVQVARADPRAACVNTDDLNGPKDDLHYTPKGYEELGKRFAATAVAMIKKAKK